MSNAKKQCMSCMEFYDSEFDICPYCGQEEGRSANELLHIDSGTIIADRYLVGNAIGYGGFGVTYMGYDQKLNRKVAIKEYLPSEFATRALHRQEVMVNNNEKKKQQFASGMNKFLQEAQKLAELSNLDGIVHIYDSFEANNTAYIVMEHLKGETLAAYLKREKKMTEQQAMDMIVPVLQTLDEVHKHGIIHRDIAPDNIFLAEGSNGETRVKLIDFGASRYASTSHSKSLTVLIKPGYSPAEQYQSNGEQGTFTDVYAVGAVLYRMVTGVQPVDAFERRTQMQSGKRDPMKDPSVYNEELTENFENALMNALNVRVEDRSPTAAAFLEELISFEPVKRRGVSIRKIDFMKWPLWAKIGVPAAGAAVIAMIVLLALGVIGFKGAIGNFKLPADMARVPDLINADVDDAQKWLEEVSLQINNAGAVYSPGIPENVVLEQDTMAGSVVMKNTVVSLTVSTGKEKYLMPDVTGMTEAYARRALECMGLTVTTVDGKKQGLSADCVVSQSIDAYTEVGTGDAVELTVVRGNTGAAGTAPELTGLSYDEAVAAAAKAGVTLTVTRKEFSHDCDAAKVTEQNIKKGAAVKNGQCIEVTVTLPWHEFPMPNLMYKTEDVAKQIMANMGIAVEAAEETNEMVASGMIFAQSVKKNETVEPGSTVKVSVSKGSKPIAMPKVVGETKENAQKLLMEAGLSVTVEYAYDAYVKEGNVISQSVEAGKEVTRGASVVLTVCSKDGLVSVADVLGWSENEAKSTLQAQNLKVTINRVASYDAQKGLVMEQLPTAGSMQKKGATIVLTVGKGGKDTVVPETKPEPKPEPKPTKKDPGTWSDWTTSVPSDVSSSQYDIEEKTQYRYRDRETTSSNSSSISGWTCYDSSSYWTDYGSWSDWSTSSVSASDSRQVDTRRIDATYTTQYNYSRYQEKDPSTGTRGWTGPSKGTWSGHYCGYYLERGWGGKLDVYDYDGSIVIYKDSNGCWYNETSRQVEQSSAYTQYRYRDRSQVTTYYFERWGSWSSWSDYSVSGDSDRQVETRTVYRYRTKGT